MSAPQGGAPQSAAGPHAEVLPRPRRVGLHLTDRCQLDCDHCLRDPGGQPLDLELDVIDAVLRDARVLHGIERVSLTGGEPTLHPRFPEVLDLVVGHRMSWNMVSNGGRFERVARWLDEVPARRHACSSVAFSLDGASDEVHDAIRGQGQRREVLAAISVAVAYRIPFSIVSTLHARNAHELEAIAREAAALGATHLRFGMTQPTGTALDASLAIPASGWREILARIERARDEAGIVIATSDGWPGAPPCSVLRGDTIHVDPRGQLTMCCMHSGLPGDPEGRSVVGDARRGLGAVPRLFDLWRQTRAALDQARTGEWAEFECNACLAQLGRPHWTGAAESGGAAAGRERWRAWPIRKRHLRVAAKR